MTRRRTPRGVAVALAAALALAGCAGGAGTDTVSGAAEGAGYTAGDGSFSTWAAAERQEPVEASGTTFDGEAIDLAQWRGDVVVLNFWYASCPPCRAEAPDLNAFAEEYSARGVHVLGVNPRDDAGTAQAFERSFGTPYPSLADPDAAVVSAFESVVPLQAMPTTVVLDREGRPAARVLGRIDPAVLRGLVDDVLGESAA